MTDDDLDPVLRPAFDRLRADAASAVPGTVTRIPWRRWGVALGVGVAGVAVAVAIVLARRPETPTIVDTAATTTTTTTAPTTASTTAATTTTVPAGPAVPDLIGMTAGYARLQLPDLLGLDVQVDGSCDDPAYNPGGERDREAAVITQSPVPGTPLDGVDRLVVRVDCWNEVPPYESGLDDYDPRAGPSFDAETGEFVVGVVPPGAHRALTRLPGMTHIDERIEALTLWGGTAAFQASVNSLRAPLDDWIGGLEGEEIRLPSGARAMIVTSGSPISDSIYAEAGPDTAVAIHYSTTSVSPEQAAAILDSVRPPP